MTPEHAEILAGIQRRAPAEGRDHLIATVEWAFGVDPAMADRLIPRAAAPVADAARADCEKPIRDEDGKFLGCEAGGGSGGGGASSSGGSPGGSAAEHDPFAVPPPRRAPKTPAAAPAPAAPSADKAARIAAERARAEAEHRKTSSMEYEPSEADNARMRAVEEGRDPDEAEKAHWAGKDAEEKQRHAAAIEKGHVTKSAVATKAKEAFAARAKEIKADAGAAHEQLSTAQEKAARAINDLTALNSNGGDTIVPGAEVDTDLSSYDSTLSAVGKLSGKEGAADHSRIVSGESHEELFEPDEVEDPGDLDEDSDDTDKENHAQAKEEYDAYVKARDEHAAKVEKRAKEIKAKAAEAVEHLDTLYEAQTAAIEKLKAAKLEVTKQARGVRKESDGIDADDLVDKKLSRAADKAYETLDGDASDEDKATAQRTVDDYEAAKSAASALISQEEEEREDLISQGGPDDIAEALDALKDAAKATKARAARLRKVTGQAEKPVKAKAAKKPATKKPAKAKAAAEEDDEDIEEDEPEDDEE